MITISYIKSGKPYDHLTFRVPSIAKVWLEMLVEDGAEHIRVEWL